MGPNEYYGYSQQTTGYQEDPSAKRRRLIIGGAGLFMFIAIIVVVLVLLFSSPSLRPEVAKIAAMQNEIARVAEIGVDSDSVRRATQVTATNVRAVGLTNTSQLTLWANDNFQSKFSKKTLATQENTETDAALEKADETNEFDETFNEAMLILLEGANDEISKQYSKFSDHPDLQNILDKVGQTNQVLIDSISSKE